MEEEASLRKRRSVVSVGKIEVVSYDDVGKTLNTIGRFIEKYLPKDRIEVIHRDPFYYDEEDD